MKIVELTAENKQLWRDYLVRVQAPHHAYFCEWAEIFRAAFGHRPHYLMALAESGQVEGILPLFEVSSLLFGRALISVPYLNSGGVIAESDEAVRALVAEAKNIRAQTGAKYLELRQQREIPSLASLPVRNHKAEMLLPLPTNSDELFKSFDKKLRSQIRRPEKDGVTAASVPLTPANIERFYRVFAENMRDLGTPVYPRALFEQTAHSLGDACRLILVTHGSTTIAGGMTVAINGRVEIPWASTLRRFNHLSANMALYWQVLRECCESGYQEFSFGRSTIDSGTYRFKAQWGAKPNVLHWYYDAAPEDVPDVNPKSSKFALMVSAWQKLPLPIANTIGPFLTRSLP